MAKTTKELIADYRRLKLLREQLEKKATEVVKPVKAAMEDISNELQRRLTEAGEQSVKTSEGTAYLQVQTSVTVQDPDAFTNWVLENGLEFMDVKANKTAAIEYMEGHEGELPPGLKYSSFTKCNIRK